MPFCQWIKLQENSSNFGSIFYVPALIFACESIIRLSKNSLGCATPYYFEPTFTLNGIPTFSIGCQASVIRYGGGGRQKLD